ncbi:MAG: PLP-dependent aminotransferase family protein [Chloroflexia bacterium]|nr:PLP-dependent aminotransferase family protein [Chloroflexia bacterium]
MSKRPQSTERPDIQLDPALPEPLYKQLYDRLRAAILAGQVPRGARLPSTRTLATELGVSRTTTALAYEQLLLEGYLESRVGRGTIVSRQLPVVTTGDLRSRSEPTPGDAQSTPLPRPTAPVAVLDTVPQLERVEGSGSKAFIAGQPALDLFPYALWARLLARRARQSLRAHAGYQPPAGYAPLREAIASHIGITRGVRCTPEQVIITSGTQGALDLVARTLLAPGDAAWIEDPGYFGARGALLAAEARVVPVPVDGEGLVVAAGRVRAPAARLAFVTPSHQFPTGVTMSLSRRLALLEWANEADAWVVEDDYDSEYRYGGRPLEALQGLDRAGRVLYAGTFSKVLFPALRLGYLVAPLQLIPALLQTRRFLDLHPPILEQMALADFLREGHYASHLRRTRRQIQCRRDCLHGELQRRLGGILDVSLPEAGLELVGWLPPGKDDQQAVALADAAGITVVAISRQSLEPPPRGGLLLGFAGIDEDAIRRGVKTLAEALAPL